MQDGHPPVHGAATINASLPAAATAINGSSTCPNPWHLLCPDGAKGQVAWRKAINAAIFYQHTAADTSVSTNKGVLRLCKQRIYGAF